MTKKEIKDYDRYLKRYGKIVSTKHLAMRLNDLDIKKLEKRVEDNKIKVMNFLRNKNLKKDEFKNEITYQISNDVNVFLKEKNEEKKLRLQSKSKFNLNIFDAMFTDNTSFFTKSQEIGEEYRKKTLNKPPSNSYIIRYLKKKINVKFLKRKYAHAFTNDSKCKRQKLVYLDVLARNLELKKKLIFIDAAKSSYNKNTVKIWIKAKEQLKKYNIGRTPGINCIAGLSDGEIVHYKTCTENLDADHFVSFMKEMERNLKEKNVDNAICILDNCSYQQSIASKKYFKFSMFKIIFLPCYQPSLNSIEFLWNVIKEKLKRKFLINS